jgi:hypothetical protein
MPLRKSLLTLLLAVGSSWALDRTQEVAEMSATFRESLETNVWTIVALGVGLLFVLAALVWLEIRKVDKFQHKKSLIGWQRFREEATSWRFTAEQLQMLEQILKDAEVVAADAVFTVPQVFETAVEHRFGMRRPVGIPEAERIREIRDILGYSRLPVETPLGSTRQLAVGDKVAISAGKSDMLGNSVIEGVTEHVWIVRNTLGKMGKPGDPFFANLVRFGDGEYRISTTVAEWLQDRVVLAHTQEMERTQQRNWVRIDVSLKLRVEIVRSNVIDVGTVLPGKLSDISGGGVSMKITTKLQMGDEVELRFEIGAQRFDHLRARVIRVSPKPVGKEELFQHSLEFVNLDSQEREKVVRFIFDRQRQERRWS